MITGLITVKKDSTEIMKHYCVTRFPQVFMHVEFEVWIGFLVLMINMVACHTFAFVDQLVIMFCIGLDEFFDDFNKRIGQERRQVTLITAYNTSCIVKIWTENQPKKIIAYHTRKKNKL